MRLRALTVLVIVAAMCVVVFQSAVLFSLTGKASGSFSVCVNQEPTIAFGCNTTIQEDILYYCTLNTSDADGDTLTHSYISVVGTIDFTNYNNGTYSVITNQSQVGSFYDVIFSINDSKLCTNSVVNASEVTFTVQNTNDAPVYIGGLPGTFEWSEGSSLRGYFLDDHFEDEDGDDLNYSGSFGASGFSVDILPSSEIVLQADSCGTTEVTFAAVDPSLEVASSGVLLIDVLCEEEEDSSSGGGGGSSTSDCSPDWRCQEWSRCRFNGTQSQYCQDVNACDLNNIEKEFTRECEYIPHCEDGQLNYDEKGIDCGGSCPACQTCSDGLLNNNEEEIDCGGPNCPACANCNDGIQNYQEEGVDCGGPSCDACISCEDGIRNGDETGVDCGGSCPACSRLESPEGLRPEESNLNRWIVSIVATLAALFIIYRLFRKRIHVFIANLLWYLLRSKTKNIVIKEDFARYLIKEIDKIENTHMVSGSQEDRDNFQDRLGRLVRELYAQLVGDKIEEEEVVQLIQTKVRASKQVKIILKYYYRMLMQLERSEHLSTLDLQLQTELLKQRIISMSDVPKLDVVKPVEHLAVRQEVTALSTKILLFNATIALEHGEVELARRKYMTALHVYEQLPENEQASLYDLLHLTFNDLLYIASYSTIH